MLSGITKPSPEPSARESDVGVHVKKLRPILRPDVKDKHVLKILRKHVMFAEETLGEFLPLVGIPPIFANLSYEYLVGFPEAELRAANVRMAAHLTFKTEGGEI